MKSSSAALRTPQGLPRAPVGVDGAVVLGVRRALANLPDEVLRAMVRGLYAHADELAPGVLFRSQNDGGCAVGITLRELSPRAFRFGPFHFWLWQRWRRGVEPDVAVRFPRLKHLQWYFDEAVAALEQTRALAHPAMSVGLWLAASAEHELCGRTTAAGFAAQTHARPGPPSTSSQPPSGVGASTTGADSQG